MYRYNQSSSLQEFLNLLNSRSTGNTINYFNNVNINTQDQQTNRYQNYRRPLRTPNTLRSFFRNLNNTNTLNSNSNSNYSTILSTAINTPLSTTFTFPLSTTLSSNLNDLISGNVGYIFEFNTSNRPVSLNNLNSRSQLIILNDENRTTYTDTTCSICSENFENNTILRKLNTCNHYFHQGCIDTWFSTHSTCPICRTNISSNRNDNSTNTSSLNTPSSTISSALNIQSSTIHSAPSTSLSQ